MTITSILGGLKPIEVIERGEVDRIWQMIFFLRSGVASQAVPLLLLVSAAAASALRLRDPSQKIFCPPPVTSRPLLFLSARQKLRFKA
jgi:hypothetical protein